MTRFRTLVSNQRGFGLIDTMMAVGITGVLLLAFMNTSVITFGTQANVESVTDFNSLFTLIQMSLDDSSACTLNFPGYQLVSGGNLTKAQEVTVSFRNANGTLGQPVAKKGLKVTPLLTVESVLLTPIAQIAVGKVIATITVKATKASDVVGPKSIQQSFPVLAYVDGAGKINSCYGGSNSAENQDVKQQICALDNSGTMYYDSVSNTCKARYKVQCFPGNQDSATCGAGAVSLATGSGQQPCSVPTAANNDPRFLDRKYRRPGLIKITTAPSSYACVPGAGLKVDCVYATDYNPTAADTCNACCNMDLSK